MKSTTFFFLLLFLTAHIAHAENPCSIMQASQAGGNWGLGALHLPACSGLDVFADFDGRFRVARLWSDEFGRLTYLDNHTRSVPRNERVLIGSKSYLKIFEQRGNALLVMMASAPQDTYYIIPSGQELAKNYRPYGEMFSASIPGIEENPWLGYLGVNLQQSCMRLRASAGLNAQIIECISSNDFPDPGAFNYIQLKRMEGDWAYVEVIVHNKPLDHKEDEGYFGSDGCWPTSRSVSGWMKIIDDDGYPNLWYPVSAY